MKNFITKHMTYKGRKEHGRKQTNQSRTLATLMSLKDGTLSKQRQIILNSANNEDDDLSDISIDSIHFDSGISCNENAEYSKPLDTRPSTEFKADNTLRVEQSGPLQNDCVSEYQNPEQIINTDPSASRINNDGHKTNDIENIATAKGNNDVKDKLTVDFDDESSVSSASTPQKNKIALKQVSLVDKHKTLPSKMKTKTLRNTTKPKKTPKNYSHSLPNGKKKRKAPTVVRKDVKFQQVREETVFSEDFENGSNITQIYNSCNEKWTTIINLDKGTQSPPDAFKDSENKDGTLLYDLDDSMEHGNEVPSDYDR
ncbi:hypothetical protein M8J76_000519 [Diaphorina citri]|nr:hypothetical protein M8J76_000519 [Diaphorina citri]